MKVFISWSGVRSHAMAVALRDWLPDVLQRVEPFVSSEDIAKGVRWASQLGEELQETNFGLICLTNENMAAPWLLFEAGALSKHLDVGRVAPLLLDVTKAQVTLPLSSFQLTDTTREDVMRLIKAINAATSAPLPEERVARQVARWWPDLQERLNAIPPPSTDSADAALTQPGRSEKAMLEELLGLVRDLGRQQASEPQKLRRTSVSTRHTSDLVARWVSQILGEKAKPEDLWVRNGPVFIKFDDEVSALTDEELFRLRQAAELSGLRIQITGRDSALDISPLAGDVNEDQVP